MDRLAATFSRLRRQRRKALIPFIVGGDPDMGATAAVIRALDEAGADVIEVGLPFSDPLADGPVIQRASFRSLTHGTTADTLFAMLRSLAPGVSAPIVILSYWNPIARYRGGLRDGAHSGGTQAFFDAAARAGVAGIIIPDLPAEESALVREPARRAGVATIFLAAPTSPPDRLRQIARLSRGFVYYVSVIGTTGVRRELSKEWLHGVRQIKMLTTTPVCVGFGISTPAQARAVARVADGVIIGSALVKALEPAIGKGRAALAAQARRTLMPFRKAV